jgi:hypothetical protein
MTATVRAGQSAVYAGSPRSRFGSVIPRRRRTCSKPSRRFAAMTVAGQPRACYRHSLNCKGASPATPPAYGWTLTVARSASKAIKKCIQTTSRELSRVG